MKTKKKDESFVRLPNVRMKKHHCQTNDLFSPIPTSINPRRSIVSQLAQLLLLKIFQCDSYALLNSVWFGRFFFVFFFFWRRSSNETCEIAIECFFSFSWGLLKFRWLGRQLMHSRHVVVVVVFFIIISNVFDFLFIYSFSLSLSCSSHFISSCFALLLLLVLSIFILF